MSYGTKIKYRRTLNNCSDSCAICLLNFNVNDNLIKTECDHYFHDDCLNTWVNTNHSRNTNISCPMCRTPISINNSRDLLNLIDSYSEFLTTINNIDNNIFNNTINIINNNNDVLPEISANEVNDILRNIDDIINRQNDDIIYNTDITNNIDFINNVNQT
jgi:hypothetical protein